METKELVKRIKAVAARTVKHEDDVQQVGLACIAQIEQYGQVTYLGDLYNALSKGDKDAFGKWALSFGGVKANLKKDRKTLPFVIDKESAPDLTAATANPWHTFQKEATPISRLLDADKALNTLIEKMCKGEGFKDPAKAIKTGCMLREYLASEEGSPTGTETLPAPSSTVLPEAPVAVQ